MYFPLYSKLLYELSKSIHKSNQDDEGTEGDSLANNMKDLVKQVCEMSGVPGVIISNRILQAFKTKIWRLKEAMVKATANGGGPVRRLLARWTTGRYSTWSFKIYYSELEPERLKQDISKLKAEKRKLQDDLDVVRCKKAKIQDKLKEAVAKNQEMNGKFKKKFKQLTQKLIRQQRRKISRGSTNQKYFQSTAGDTNVEFESKWSPTVKPPYHFWGCTILSQQKLKCLMRILSSTRQ